ncbi:Zinc finger protein dzip1l, partial [Rhizoclosmatium hyalinum]
MAGFYFKRRTERLDWRLLASLQVERVQREVDITALQEIMENITFCDVDSEDVRYVDPNFLKLFKISQLIIEYLVHTQDFLTDTQAVLSQDLQSTLDQLEVLTGKFEKQTTEFNAMKKENRNLKKTLYAYQLMARVPGYTGGGAGADGGGNEAASYHRCIHCTKVFKAAVFLENHMLRRHPEVAPRPASPTSQNQNYHQQQQAYYQQQQQPHMMNQPTSPGQPGMFGGMFPGAFNPMMFGTNDFSQVVAAKIKESEASLRAEMEERMAKEIEAKQKAIQQKYEQERLKNESEIQHLKAEIHQQLSDERAQFEDEKIQLETII